jgi:formate--tetrahydrofolate ligase
MARRLADYVITEAGFGADLGAEKFMDIIARYGGFAPSCVVIVATIRALKMHGGVAKTDLGKENIDALLQGIENLNKHVENVKKFCVPYVIAINRFVNDTDEEINTLLDWAKANCHEISLTEVWAKGGEGGEDLAHKVIRKIEQNDGMCHFHHLYDVNLSIKEKMNIIAREIYGADAVEYSPTANKQIKTFEENGWDKLPICVAKTQYSLSDNAKLLGRPHGFVVTVREFKPSIGAGFIVALMGDIMTMPGLPKVPASNAMDVIDNKIVGLF